VQIPISYHADVQRAEEIVLAAAQKFTAKSSEISEDALAELERRYFVQRSDLQPKVFLRLTDNWIELSVRFIASDHGVREVKNSLSREILAEFSKAKLGIASGTYEIVGMPPISVRLDNSKEN
jgi:small-conductance mechanosensitive channel